ncbi:MAG TPA: glucokinase [Lachnospiraceae bacterium]|nr:glucokinase [Lachnospiraceae bacterium]
MEKYAFGIDLGGTTVKLGLFTTEGELEEKWEIPTRKEKNGEMIIGDIASSIREKMEEKHISFEDVKGAGIAVPGAVIDDGIVNKCVNLGWGVKNVRKELSYLLEEMTIKVANDANAAALGEMWKGGGRGYDSIVMVTLGTGVGGGVIIDGKILNGANGAGGEIGHINIDPEETEVCGCGNRGCLEQYVSATGYARMTKKYLRENKEKPSILRDIEEPTAKDLFDAAKQHDGAALEIVDKCSKILGRGFAIISAVVDPDAFVIGGGVSKAGDIVLDGVKEYYRAMAFHASRDTKFELAKLGNDAGIYGSVKIIL